MSEWWASGLHTRRVDPRTGRTLVERGATLSVHAAAGLGLTDHLERMLAADPALIDAKGCDACTPLHFSRDVATAQLLLDHGARIDARDEDHDSTPAPWLIGDAPEVARFLLDRGAPPDIFMAAALGAAPSTSGPLPSIPTRIRSRGAPRWTSSIHASARRRSGSRCTTASSRSAILRGTLAAWRAHSWRPAARGTPSSTRPAIRASTSSSSSVPHRIDGAALLGDEDLVSRLLGDEPPADQLALALAGAARGGHAALCRRLLALGAAVNDATGRDCLTPLMQALTGSSAPGSPETVALLLAAGADVSIRNRNGTLALHDPVLEISVPTPTRLSRRPRSPR